MVLSDQILKILKAETNHCIDDDFVLFLSLIIIQL